MKAYIITLISVLIAIANPIAAQHEEIGQELPEPVKTIEKVKPLKAVESLKTIEAVYEPPKPQKAAVAPSAQGSCEDWLRQAGIPITEATKTLIIKESGCRTTAINPSSGACGIAQAWPCSKMKCPLNDSGAICQLKWMDTYIKDRYGTWDNALSMWYSRCGSPQGCWY